ncbi:MAG: diacylglycerol kinase family protein [Spirochaetia bacterium]|nr:diacylglycerol kinase family protein [Spirochaetia bacterium]
MSKKKIKDCFLIYNRKSKQNIKNAKDFATTWQSKIGSNVIFRETKSLEDIQVAAKESLKKECIPVFLGGDGTFSECLQGLAESEKFKGIKIPVGLLSGGTGNSFLRDFNVVNFKTAKEKFIDAVLNNRIQKIDMGILKYKTKDEKIVQRIVFNIWSAGIIGKITELAIKMRFIGSFNYTAATIMQLLFHKPFDFEVTIDQKKENMRIDFVSVSNSRFTGGAMEMAPPVKINDGKLFYVIPRINSPLKLLTLFPKIFKGEHIKHKKVLSGFCKNLSIKYDKEMLMNIDGEIERGYNSEIKIMPKFWSLYI